MLDKPYMLYGKNIVIAHPLRIRKHGTKKQRKKKFNRYYQYIAKMKDTEVYDTPTAFIMTENTWIKLKEAM